MIRDERWEKVYGYIRPRNETCPPIDEDMERIQKDLIEIRLEVVWNKSVWYQVHILDKEDLEFLGFILNKMVEQLDEYMEEHG